MSSPYYERPWKNKIWTPNPRPTKVMVKAKIVKASYFERGDTVTYECVLEGGEPYFLHWPREEYYHAITRKGVARNGEKIVVPVKILLDHLKTLPGKEFTVEKTISPEGGNLGES